MEDKSSYPILTQEDVNKLDWIGPGTHALADRKEKRIWMESEDEDTLLDALRVLGTKHPLYRRLQLVEKDKYKR